MNLSENSALELGNLPNQPPFLQAIIAGHQSLMLKKILGAWIARDLSPALTYQNLYLAIRFELKECLEPAVRLLRQPGDVSANEAARDCWRLPNSAARTSVR